MKKKLWILSFIMAMIFMMAGVNFASAYTITSSDLDGASSVDIITGESYDPSDPTSVAPGMTNWTVGGGSSSQLKLQWFWFTIDGTTTRLGVGADNIEKYPGYVSNNPLEQINIDELEIDYTYLAQTPTAQKLEVETIFGIKGGFTPPSGHINEVITFKNYDTEYSLELGLYEYNDFDLAGTPAYDTGVAYSITQINQNEGNSNISEVSALSPDSYEIGLQNAILGKVEAGGVLNPNGIGNVFDPGPNDVDDVAWAFFWDLTVPKATIETLPDGSQVVSPGTITISKDKNIVTPVPTTLLLFGSGLFSLIGVGIRRRKS